MVLINFDTIREIENLTHEEGADFLRECFEIYQVEVPLHIRKMCQAAQNKDMAAVRGEAHSLKSSSGNLGAETMQQLCAELESVEESEPLSESIFKIQRLNDVFLETAKAMNRILLARPASEPGDVLEEALA